MNTDASNVEDITIHHIKECLLHLLRMGFASSALDHSLCARMIWILTTCLILLRCKIPSYRFQQWICPCALRTNRVVVHSQVFPFLLPTFHQISTLEKTTSRQYSILSSLMNKRPSQVSPFLATAHSTSSEVFDFHIWFSPGFQMQ